MHGLINRTVQRFVTDTYGAGTWERVARGAELGFVDFEAMLLYEEELTPRVLRVAAEILARPESDLLEDIGTYLVSHPKTEAVRRLLRFGGEDFVDFLHSLDDLPDRARLAVADLDLPQLELREHAADRFSLTVRATTAGFGHVMMGLLRTLADDYGTLAIFEHGGGRQGRERVDIALVEAGYASGRRFELGGGVPGTSGPLRAEG